MATFHSQLVIVGGGPAGMTAAIYAGRAGLRPLVLNGETIGGQLGRTDDVEDFPGFVEGIIGRRLVELFFRQAVRFGAEIRFERVTDIDLSRRPFMLATSEDRRIACDALILALGASPCRLGVPGEETLRGRGVHHTAVGRAARYAGMPQVVVGGGDSAAEAALYAARFASRVIVVHRRDRLRAANVLQQRLARSDKIQFAWSSVVTRIIGETGVESVVIESLGDIEPVEVPASAVYVTIGQKPNTELVRGQLDLTRSGYVVVEPGTCRTSVDGVFACGEIMDPSYRQAITAAGMGCMASIDAERFLGQAMVEELEMPEEELILTPLMDDELAEDTEGLVGVTVRESERHGPPEDDVPDVEDLAEELLHDATTDR